MWGIHSKHVVQPSTHTTTTTKEFSLSALELKDFQLLSSLDSFDVHGPTPPTLASRIMTGIVTIGFLILVELCLRNILLAIKHVHPLLQKERNRHILARHLGVDVLSCLVCFVLGWFGRDVVADAFWPLFGNLFFTSRARKKQQPTSCCKEENYQERLFQPYAEGYRLAFFYLCYQIKNSYDSLLWNDGPEFLLHHMFSGLAAISVMDGGIGHYYAVFYLGLSECSTAILSLLVNFDDTVHGVPGLAQAFPQVKLLLGAVFITFFVLCRCILWPLVSVRFFKDVHLAFDNGIIKTLRRKQRWTINYLMIANAFLSILQVLWLGQIFLVAREEFQKFWII